LNELMVLLHIVFVIKPDNIDPVSSSSPQSRKSSSKSDSSKAAFSIQVAVLFSVSL
jgi:hypothetical protein